MSGDTRFHFRWCFWRDWLIDEQVKSKKKFSTVPDDNLSPLPLGEAAGGGLDCTLTQGEAGESLDWQLVSRASNLLAGLQLNPR